MQRHKGKGAELPWQGKELYDRRDIMRQTILDLAKEWEPLRREQEDRDRQHKEEKKRKRLAKLAADEQTSKEASVDGQTAPSRPETPPPAETQAESISRTDTESRAIIIEDDDDSTTASSPAKQALPLAEAASTVNLAPDYGSDAENEAESCTLPQPGWAAREVQSPKVSKRPRTSADLTATSQFVAGVDAATARPDYRSSLHAKRVRLSETSEVATSSSAPDASHMNLSYVQ